MASINRMSMERPSCYSATVIRLKGASFWKTTTPLPRKLLLHCPAYHLGADMGVQWQQWQVPEWQKLEDWRHWSGCSWDSRTTAAPKNINNGELMQWFHENGCLHSRWEFIWLANEYQHTQKIKFNETSICEEIPVDCSVDRALPSLNPHTIEMTPLFPWLLMNAISFQSWCHKPQEHLRCGCIFLLHISKQQSVFKWDIRWYLLEWCYYLFKSHLEWNDSGRHWIDLRWDSVWNSSFRQIRRNEPTAEERPSTCKEMVACWSAHHSHSPFFPRGSRGFVKCNLHHPFTRLLIEHHDWIG